MSLLFSREIRNAVEKELSAAKESIHIITAFCKLDALQFIDKLIGESVISKKIMLRFRLDDIIKGSTDFEVLDFCRDNCWKVYIRFDLHAKIYIIDDKKGIIGSANTTSSGIGIGRILNLEMSSLIKVDEQDLSKIEKLYDEALFVDEELYKKLKEEMFKNKDDTFDGVLRWSNEIINLFHPKIDELFSYELFGDRDVSLQDNFFLKLPIGTGNAQLKEAFRWSNVYLWLLNVLKENQGCLYFGELTKRLHEVLVSDSELCRKEVKDLLANLLVWIEILEMEEIVVDRPNYSQRIRLKELY